MTTELQDRFTLCQVSPDDWVIFDMSLNDDVHRLVACVSEHDGFVQVRWFRNLPLPEQFATRDEALGMLLALDLTAAARPAALASAS
ncbi:hypothetical protein ACFWHT_02120 [Microbacterium sp. NPDC058342]|uniref:hypothetical protein n=1 Tax=Microbacterium sp. NPDC058342 TaxID=3346454 RepID=UPI00365338B8